MQIDRHVWCVACLQKQQKTIIKKEQKMKVAVIYFCLHATMYSRSLMSNNLTQLFQLCPFDFF